MLDLLLINPGGQKKIYQDLDTAKEPPLWCRLIAGYIRDSGYKVQIIDADAEDLSPEEVADRVREKHPRLTGVIVYGHQPSASTQQMVSASEICKAIKKPGFYNNPHHIVIAGGHVSALPEKTFNEECVDYVAIGEGAATIKGILSQDLRTVPGLLWQLGRNAPATLLSLEELHGDAWDLLPMDKYRAHNWQTGDRQPYASIYTSLQCPYKCSFCCINATFGGSGYRTRKPEDVVAEVKMLHDTYGVKTFKIIDEMFVLKPSHYVPICEGLAELDLDLNIWAYARIDTVKPETLSLMRKAGIQWLALGIESGSEYVRDGADKSLSGQDIHNTVRAIQDADIKVMGNFIFGLPDDTMDSMQETLDLALALKCDFVNFYVCQPYPGSPLFNQTKKEDLPGSWDGYSQHSKSCKPLPTKTLTPREVLEFRDYAHCEYFKGQGDLCKPLERDLFKQSVL